LAEWDSWLGLKGEVLLLLYQVWFGRIILVSVDTVTFSESELDKQSLAGWRLFWMRLKGGVAAAALVWQLLWCFDFHIQEAGISYHPLNWLMATFS
jgi:hypothetical protein